MKSVFFSSLGYCLLAFILTEWAAALALGPDAALSIAAACAAMLLVGAPVVMRPIRPAIRFGLAAVFFIASIVLPLFALPLPALLPAEAVLAGMAAMSLNGYLRTRYGVNLSFLANLGLSVWASIPAAMAYTLLVHPHMQDILPIAMLAFVGYMLADPVGGLASNAIRKQPTDRKYRPA